MRKIKGIILGAMIASAIGIWFGVNIGKGKPIFSNPFVEQTLQQRLKQTGEKLLEKSGEIMKKSGQTLEQRGRALQKKFEGDESQ